MKRARYLALLLPLVLLAPANTTGRVPTPPREPADAIFRPFVLPSTAVTLRPAPFPEPRRTAAPQAFESGSSVAAARAYALGKIGSTQYHCLDLLWTRESHWNPYDLNRSSGAYGIPQALPGSKMALAGADWRTNAVTQVRWGLGYIRVRYGTPCAAWAHSQATGWY